MTSSSARKYGFGSSLINENGEVISPELELAKKIAYQEGYDEGIQVAKTQIENDTKRVLESCANQLETLTINQNRAYEYIQGAVLSLGLEMTKKLFPKLLEENAETIVRNFIEDVLSNVGTTNKITIHTHKDLVEIIKTKTTDLIENETLEIILKEAGDFNRFDCKADWDDGGVEQFPYKMIEEIERALKNYLEHVPLAETKIQEVLETEEAEPEAETNAENITDATITGEENV